MRQTAGEMQTKYSATGKDLKKELKTGNTEKLVKERENISLKIILSRTGHQVFCVSDAFDAKP